MLYLTAIFKRELSALREAGRATTSSQNSGWSNKRGNAKKISGPASRKARE